MANTRCCATAAKTFGRGFHSVDVDVVAFQEHRLKWMDLKNQAVAVQKQDDYEKVLPLMLRSKMATDPAHLPRIDEADESSIQEWYSNHT